VCGWQVKLCDHDVTHGPYMYVSTLEMLHDTALHKFMFNLLQFTYGDLLIYDSTCMWNLKTRYQKHVYLCCY